MALTALKDITILYHKKDMTPYLRSVTWIIGFFLTQAAFATGPAEPDADPSAKKLQPTEIQLVSFLIPHFSESEQQGSFIKLYRAIEHSAGYPIKLSLMPTKRAQLNFQQSNADVYFPGLQTSIPGKHLRSEIVFYKEVFAFVHADNQIPSSLADLASLRIGLTAGYNYGEILQYSNFNIQEAQSDKVNLLKLEAGRIDVFLVERYSGLRALKESQVDNIKYDLHQPLSSEPVFFIFQNTERGLQLKELFNQEILRLRASGRLNSILLDN